MKILLINPYTDSESTAGKYKRFLSPMPPISLAYVAAALEKAGYPVSIYDDYTTGGNHTLLAGHIKKTAPDIIGLTCVTMTAPRTYEIARWIKKEYPGVKVVLGNIHPSIFYKEIIDEWLADAVVIGEGERTFPELAAAFQSGSDLSGVKGIAFRGDETVVTEPMPYVEDLDTIPFPAWHLFPLERYRIFNFARVREPGTLVLGSRGCPYGCNFCSLKIMGHKRRRRSAGNIADEFEFLHDEFGYVQMSFIDPIFPFTEEVALTFSNELLRRGLQKKMTWITETRVDLVNEKMLAAMKESGLSRIMYGFETGSAEGLDSIRKTFTMDQARATVAMTNKAGVQMIGFFMIGVPGDTVETIEETIRYSQSLDIEFAKFTVFSPFPGTKIYEELKASGEMDAGTDWARFTNYPVRGKPPAFLPKGVSNNDIIRLQKKAFARFYLRPGMALKHLFKIRTIGLRDILSGIITLFAR